MVPPATLADFDHIYPEFAVFGSHLGQLARLLYPAFILAKLVAVHVGDVGQPGLPADRAAIFGGLAMELRGPQQVRMSVADVGDRRVPGIHGRERSPAGQPVVHDRTP